MFYHDFSDFPESLYNFALDQITWYQILCKDSTNQIYEASNAKKLRNDLINNDKFGFWIWWLRFGIGVETLIKAVFLKHQISLLTKRDLLSKAPGGQNELMTPAAADVYRIVSSTNIISENNSWLESEFRRLGIQHPLEINSGTLGKYINNLHRLKNADKINMNEQKQISDSLTVLADIRRNVDAHVYLKSQVGGSMQKDLTKVYIPVINLLIKVYNR